MSRLGAAAPRVLITGAASGLGAALAARYAAAGARVVRADIATPTSSLPGATFLHLDVTSEVDWRQAIERVHSDLGGLDVLVNNAGIASGGRIDQVDTAHWQRMFEINVLGAVNGCRTFTPLFKEQGCGHIVNIASLAGLVHPAAMSPYTAGKAAVVAVSESLRYELAPWGIDVSVVCPSFFRSNLSSSVTGADPLAAHVATKLIDRAPRNADDVAVQVIDAINRKRFLVLPDRSARLAYWTKRLARPLYDRQMRGAGVKICQAERRDTTTQGAQQ